MKIYRRYAYFLFGSGLAFVAVLAALAWLLDPPWGDLTRLGWLPESLYGNRLPEEVVRQKRYDKDSYSRYYHLLAIGDSFTHAEGDKIADLRVWQNRLQLQTGLQIGTFNVKTKDWRELVAAPMFRAAPPELFVYEIVERSLLARLGAAPADPAACADERAEPSARPPLPVAPVPAGPELLMPLPRPQHALDIDQLTYARDFLGKSIRRWRGKLETPVVRLPLSQPLFSSRRADQLLVIRDDLYKRDWRAEELRNMVCNLQQMQRSVEQNGHTRLVVMIVPDKLSAYADFIAEPGYANLSVIDRLAASGLPLARVDLALRAAIVRGVQDVYAPDNTHLSSRGYVILADALLGHLVAAKLALPGTIPPPIPSAPRLACRVDRQGRVAVEYSGPELDAGRQGLAAVNYYLAQRDGDRMRFIVDRPSTGPVTVNWQSGPLPVFRRTPLQASATLQLPTDAATHEIWAGWGKDDRDMKARQRYVQCALP
jgi:hypothetical protein